jgi:lipoprotein-releasing system permease protein
MAGIAVGVAALIIVLSVMNGFNKVIRDRHLKAEPHLTIHAPGGESAISWLAESGAKIRSVLGENLDSLEYATNQDVIVKSMDGYFSGAQARGLSMDSINTLVRRHEEQASKPPSDWQLSAGEVVVGADLGESLRLIPGDRVVLIAPEALLLSADVAPPLETVTVKGFFSSNLADASGKLLLFDQEKSLLSLSRNASREREIGIFLRSSEQFEQERDKLQAAGFNVQTWAERNGALFFALKMEKLAMTIFLSLSALITGFSILTVLILLVTQKRKDIGILMAMGLNRLTTTKIFAGVGLWLAGLGVASGLLIGVLVCLSLDNFPIDILPSIYYDRTIPAKVSPILVITVLLAAMGLALLGAWYPARWSARGSPSEALRGSTKDL